MMGEAAEKITAINDVNEGFDVVTTAQTIRLRIDMQQSCCETSGYLMTNDAVDSFIGAEVRGVSVTDTALKHHDVLDIYGGGTMFINIDTDRGVLQFAAYNEHNGYYGHDASVECTQLSHSEVL